MFILGSGIKCPGSNVHFGVGDQMSGDQMSILVSGIKSPGIKCPGIKCPGIKCPFLGWGSKVRGSNVRGSNVHFGVGDQKSGDRMSILGSGIKRPWDQMSILGSGIKHPRDQTSSGSIVNPFYGIENPKSKVHHPITAILIFLSKLTFIMVKPFKKQFYDKCVEVPRSQSLKKLVNLK